MESLAIVVSVLLSIALFSAPVSILLSSRIARRLTPQPTVNIFRRVLMAVISALGATVSIFFIASPIPPGLKIASLIAIVANLWAMDREYGGHLLNRTRSLVGRAQ